MGGFAADDTVKVLVVAGAGPGAAGRSLEDGLAAEADIGQRALGKDDMAERLAAFAARARPAPPRPST